MKDLTKDEKLNNLVLFRVSLEEQLTRNNIFIREAVSMNLLATSHVLKLAGDETQKAINYVNANIKKVKESL